ncbi:hypothetical protein RFI_01295, partial [Reticulomyxa filosa]
FIDNEIDLFDLLHYNDMMGANHGCIYYSLSLSAKDLQFKETALPGLMQKGFADIPLTVQSFASKTLGKVDDKTTKNLIEQVQYFYDHILCLREWLESLYCTSDKFRFGQCSFTEFEIEINGEQIELVIHKNEEKKTKEVNIYDWSDCNDDNNSSADNNASIVNMYAWDNVQVGDEFTYICQEGVSAMSNATQYIVLGEYIDFTNEKELNNNKIRNGWNIIDLLKADDEIEQNQLCEVFSKSCTFWKKKIKYAKEQIDLFIAMLNKAHKSIWALAITHSFDQMTVFPVLPNLVHLTIEDININSCFNSINMKGLMPQLKTLAVYELSMGPCMYCNWEQVLKAAEECDFNDANDSLLASFSNSSSWIKQKQNCSQIKFLNHLLSSCPNLLALDFRFDKTDLEGVLEIPSTLEWLKICENVDLSSPFAIPLDSNSFVRIDLSQCKRINGLSLILFCFIIQKKFIIKKKDVRSSIIKWPTDTILKIGWLKIDNQRDIAYWDNLLSSPIRHCDVQICAARPRMAIYDLTSNGSIFPPAERFFFTEATIAEQPGIQYRDAEKFLQKQKGIIFETDFEDNDSDNGKDIQRPTLFFQNIVEAMGIDNAKMEEYRKWFDIGEADWILNLY